MITAIILISLLITFGIVKFALKMSWGVIKLVFGLLSFFCIPLLIIGAVLGLIIKALPLILICGICFLVFRKAA